MDYQLTARVEKRAATLPQRLQAHLHRTAQVSAELAPHHGVDVERARVGSIAHDIAKAMSKPELLRQADRFGLPVNLVERANPGLLHGAVGAELLRHEEGMDDQSLYESVCWHTFAHPALDPLGKIVFLADKLDPAKVRRYPFQPYLMELAQDDLDRAVLEFVTRQITVVLQTGKMVHPLMVEARNHLIAAGATSRETGTGTPTSRS